MARVLIVDDDADLVAGQKAFLEEAGYDVMTAGSIEEGVTRATSSPPDGVIADLMMEHYDSGFVFSQRVRALPGLAHVPILMQTAVARNVGFTFEAGSAKGKEWMKVDEALSKPVPLEHLLGKVRRYLSQRRSG